MFYAMLLIGFNFIFIFHRDKVQVMVISLGKISLKTAPKDDRKDISMMHSLQFTNEDIMKEVMDQAYDKFRLDIENIQVNNLTSVYVHIDRSVMCLSFRFC